MAGCVRLSLIDTDPGWSSRGEPTKVDGVWDRMRSQLCVIQRTSLFLSLPPSAALGPGAEGCLWKVMEIRWNVVLPRRY